MISFREKLYICTALRHSLPITARYKQQGTYKQAGYCFIEFNASGRNDGNATTHI